MDWLEVSQLDEPGRRLLGRLWAERIVWDPADAAAVEVLRGDAERIASDMDDPARQPPMFWSGVPLPPEGPEPSCPEHLAVSIGGTNTNFAILRLDRGKLVGFDLIAGAETSDPAEIARIKTASQMPTPQFGPTTPTGQEMVHQTASHLARNLAPHRAALERCRGILLSWGFAHRAIRTGPRLVGGLSALATKMTKGQAGFTPHLAGKDIGALFEGELRSLLGWSRPVAVANDTVMSLHYFLGPSRRAGHAQVGLFINGTGTNFALAEPYAVRAGGVISRPGEDYAPERLGPRRHLGPGERIELYLVNYESGSVEMGATRTRFDTETEYPIERNALAGGHAFGRQLKLFVEELIAPGVYEGIRRSCGAGGGAETALATGRQVAELAIRREPPEFPAGSHSDPNTAGLLRLVARAIIDRSALHAALILAATTLRTGFGRGTVGVPDLLGMEGSVWKIPGYGGRVRQWWQVLLGSEPLNVDFAAEPSFNASLPGPLFLAALHV